MSQDKTNDYLYIRQVWQQNGSVVSMLIDQSVFAMYFRFTVHAVRSAESMPHKHAYGICLVAGFWFCFDFYRGVIPCLRHTE